MKWTRASARLRHARAAARGGYRREEVRRGDYRPLRFLATPAMRRELLAARVGGERLYVPRAQ